jgi:chromodomain-helicase-DNA-binding protein 1
MDFLCSSTIRDIAGEACDPANPWASREFFVKWKGFSYLHCSWDRLETLRQLPGHKRVLNYMKRVDDMERAKGFLSREEQELLDVQRQMEEQLAEQYTQVRLGQCMYAMQS